MGKYKYDTITWTERIPFIFISLCYIFILILVIWQQLRIKMVLYLRYGKNALIMYCVTIAITVFLRLLYFYSGDDAIPTPSVLYGITVYFPPLFMIATCIFFLNYLLNSLHFRFGRVQGKRYAIFETISQVFLAILFPIQVAFFIYSACQTHNENFTAPFKWIDIFQNVNNISYLIISAFLIYIIKSYTDKLELFSIDFYNRKTAIKLVIISTFVQIVARIVNALLIIFDVYLPIEEKTHEENFPYAQLCFSAYILLSDVILILSYTYYIKKDTENLTAFRMKEAVNEERTKKLTTCESFNITGNDFDD